MLEHLKAYLQKRVAITDEQFALISDKLKVKHFAKNEMILMKGDGVSIEDESHIGILSKGLSEFLLFDLG